VGELKTSQAQPRASVRVLRSTGKLLLAVAVVISTAQCDTSAPPKGTSIPPPKATPSTQERRLGDCPAPKGSFAVAATKAPLVMKGLNKALQSRDLVFDLGARDYRVKRLFYVVHIPHGDGAAVFSARSRSRQRTRYLGLRLRQNYEASSVEGLLPPIPGSLRGGTVIFGHSLFLSVGILYGRVSDPSVERIVFREKFANGDIHRDVRDLCRSSFLIIDTRPTRTLKSWNLVGFDRKGRERFDIPLDVGPIE
jgi:hypothetical protein